MSKQFGNNSGADDQKTDPSAGAPRSHSNPRAQHQHPDKPVGQPPDGSPPADADLVDEESMDSFPASDPPSYTGTTAAPSGQNQPVKEKHPKHTA